MIRRTISLAAAAAILAGCSASPTSIASTRTGDRSQSSAPKEAPSLSVMRQLLPARLSPEQAKRLLVQVSMKDVFLPSHAQYEQAPQEQSQPNTGEEQAGQEGMSPQQPPSQRLAPPSGGAPSYGGAPAIGAPGYAGMPPYSGYGLGTYGLGSYGLGAYGLGACGVCGYGFPGIAGFYPFDYLGFSWYAPYYLDAGFYLPFAFSGLWTGLYPYLGAPFWGWNLGLGSFGYAPFGFGPWGWGALGCGCF
ncbi:MAG: hypothetical protein KGR26_11885 [Cyanobacteria bacterium REEB65]|nr:hypothetical protein [Cyanobacteria bacterium REEB65]